MARHGSRSQDELTSRQGVCEKSRIHSEHEGQTTPDEIGPGSEISGSAVVRKVDSAIHRTVIFQPP